VSKRSFFDIKRNYTDEAAVPAASVRDQPAAPIKAEPATPITAEPATTATDDSLTKRNTNTNLSEMSSADNANIPPDENATRAVRVLVSNAEDSEEVFEDPDAVKADPGILDTKENEMTTSSSAAEVGDEVSRLASQTVVEEYGMGTASLVMPDLTTDSLDKANKLEQNISLGNECVVGKLSREKESNKTELIEKKCNGVQDIITDSDGPLHHDNGLTRIDSCLDTADESNRVETAKKVLPHNESESGSFILSTVLSQVNDNETLDIKINGHDDVLASSSASGSAVVFQIGDRVDTHTEVNIDEVSAGNEIEVALEQQRLRDSPDDIEEVAVQQRLHDGPSEGNVKVVISGGVEIPLIPIEGVINADGGATPITPAEEEGDFIRQTGGVARQDSIEEGDEGLVHIVQGEIPGYIKF